MGSGVFLLAATEYLAEVHQSRVSEENSEGESISVQASHPRGCWPGVCTAWTWMKPPSATIGVLSCAFQSRPTRTRECFQTSARKQSSGLTCVSTFFSPTLLFAYEEQKRKRRAGNANKKCFEDKNTALLRELKSVRSNIKVTKEKLNAGGASLQMTFLSHKSDSGRP